MHEHQLTLGGLETTVVEPAAKSKANIIVLHGYSMSPAALTPFAHSLGLDATFYFPRAPHAVEDGWTWWSVDKEAREKALASGPRDLANTRPDRVQVRQQMLQFVHAVGHREPHHTILCGFSQGGMLSLDLLLMEQVRVDALALFSACLIDHSTWSARVHQIRHLPIFLSHGSRDLDLAFDAGNRLREFLLAAGGDVRWVEFDGGHEIPLLVWRQFKQFVNRLPSRGM